MAKKINNLLPIPDSLHPAMRVPPPLEAEPPHRRLARLTSEHAETTAKLQELKKAWAERNMKAQARRQAISTAEITAFEKAKRELALAIQNVQTAIGRTNKEIRERRLNPPPAAAKPKIIRSKDNPLKEHREYPIYFLLAARNELEPRLFPQSNVPPNRCCSTPWKQGCNLESAIRCSLVLGRRFTQKLANAGRWAFLQRLSQRTSLAISSLHSGWSEVQVRLSAGALEYS